MEEESTSLELQEFAQENFSPAAFVGNALSSASVRQAIARVESAFEQSRKNVELELNNKRHILISKMNELDKSESNISGIKTTSEVLLREVSEIERLVGSPISQARDSILRTEFIGRSLEVLRELTRLEQLVSNLNQMFPYVSDTATPVSPDRCKNVLENIFLEEGRICEICETAKSAQRLLESPVFSNISIAQQQSEYVNRCVSILDSAIRTALLDLVHSRSQVDVGNMLLGAYYLDTIEATLEFLVQEVISKLSHKIREIFFLEQSDTNGTEPISKMDLWKRLTSLKEVILDGHRSILLLEAVLWRKFPWDSHKPLAALVTNQNSVQVWDGKQSEDNWRHFLTKRFYFTTRETLKSQLEATSTSVRGTLRARLFDLLVDMYPDVSQLFKDLESSVCEQASEEELFDSFISLALNFEGLDFRSLRYAEFDLVSTLQAFEVHYFAKSFSRLSAPLEQLFENPKSSFSEDAVGALIKLMESEFLSNIELFESSNLYEKNIVSIIDMFVAKAEQTMNNFIGEEWNPSQSTFMDRLSSLSSFYNGMILFEENLKRLPAIVDRKVKHIKGVTITSKFSEIKTCGIFSKESVVTRLNSDIQSAREALSSLLCIFIDEVFDKALDCLRSLILLMHDSDGLKPGVFSLMSTRKDSELVIKNKEEFENVSKTVQGLVRFLEQYNYSFITLLRDHHLFKEKMEHFISRVVLYYLRNVSILHPLTEQLKYQLLADFATLEGVLSSLCPTWAVGYQNLYGCLRSFRMLLFSETEEILSNSEDISSKKSLCNIYPSLILHHLLSRWNIPKLYVFEQPEWNLKRYLYFWETHSERYICEQASEHLEKCLTEMSNVCSEDDIKTLRQIPTFISKILDKYE